MYFGFAANETSKASSLFIAQSHYLESWGDSRTFDGTLLPVQPMIEPLFETFNELEILSLLAGIEKSDAYSIVRETFEEQGGSDFNKFLSNGLLEGSAYKALKLDLDPASVVSALGTAALDRAPLSASNLEVRFKPSSHSADGRYANNGWLMECPDAMTKLTWDNAILISPRLAKELEQRDGIQIFPNKTPMNKKSEFFEGAKGTLQSNKAVFKRGKEQAVLARLTLNGRTIVAPIHVLPGMANYTIELPLGMGRTEVGRVGRGVGFNAYKVRESDSSSIAIGASLELTEETYNLANTRALVNGGSCNCQGGDC